MKLPSEILRSLIQYYAIIKSNGYLWPRIGEELHIENGLFIKMSENKKCIVMVEPYASFLIFIIFIFLIQERVKNSTFALIQKGFPYDNIETTEQFLLRFRYDIISGLESLVMKLLILKGRSYVALLTI